MVDRSTPPPVNYLRHLQGVFSRWAQDERITPVHIALYIALFQYWNSCRFRNPLSIARFEIMTLAKIRSVSTYVRCMRALHEWAYISYQPSYSPHIGSRVHMFDFCTGPGQDTARLIAPSSKGVEESIEDIPPHGQPAATLRVVSRRPAVPVAAPSSPASRGPAAVPASVGQVEAYFSSRGQGAEEGRRFFHYYAARHWRTGALPVADWTALAESWIARTHHFTHRPPSRHVRRRSGRTGPPADRPSRQRGDTDYSEPL